MGKAQKEVKERKCWKCGTVLTTDANGIKVHAQDCQGEGVPE